jgi:hypothetical protein
MRNSRENENFYCPYTLVYTVCNVLAISLAAAIPLSNSLANLASLPDSWLYHGLDLQIHQRCFPLSVPGSPGDMKGALTTAEAQGRKGGAEKIFNRGYARTGSLILFF